MGLIVMEVLLGVYLVELSIGCLLFFIRRNKHPIKNRYWQLTLLSNLTAPFFVILFSITEYNRTQDDLIFCNHILWPSAIIIPIYVTVTLFSFSFLFLFNLIMTSIYIFIFSFVLLSPQQQSYQEVWQKERIYKLM